MSNKLIKNFTSQESSGSGNAKVPHGGGASSGRPPGANEPWFTILLQGDQSFGVYSFQGYEEVSTCFEFTVELIHTSANVDINSFIGSPVSLFLTDRGGGKRVVNGLVREFLQLHTANMRTHYRCIIVPRFWFLSQTRDHRIFQEKSVLEIIQQLLEEQGFAGDSFAIKCGKQYQPKTYCVQYGESDLALISRLCEEEGIYYYFEHSEGAHTLCFCDMPGGPPIAGDPNVRFFAGSGQPADSAVIARLMYSNSSHSNKATYRDWNFSKPKLDLNTSQEETDPQKAPVPPGINFDTYSYPHLYSLKDEGAGYVDLQLQRQICRNITIECQGDVARFIPSYTFTLMQHSRQDVNKKWWILSVKHFGEQPTALGHEAPERGMLYESSITAIPNEVQFIPEIRHGRHKIYGQQVAIVTGPEGEEIYPDKYGRVKVQFFWDREGEWNEKTTCWIRVAQGWAGGEYGMMTIPRIGHEVLVSFLDGDPDRPIITGRVYHELNKPPYPLPENKTRTVFKSYSSPSTEKQRYNELRIEDKANEEEIYVHAEKDVNIYVKNDWADNTCANRSETIGGNHMVKTTGKTHRALTGDRVTNLQNNDLIKIDGSRLTLIKGDDSTRSDAVIQIEAVSGISLKVGSSSIVLLPDAIHIEAPMIYENCGGEKGQAVSEIDIEPDAPKGVGESPVPGGGEMAKPMPPLQGMPAGATPSSSVSGAGANESNNKAAPVGQSPMLIAQTFAPAHVQKFFDEQYSRMEKLGKELETNPDYLMALSSYESGWLNDHNRHLNNLFGMTQAGGRNIQFDSLDSCVTSWKKYFGEGVKGAQSMEDFTARLRKMGYNSVNKDYDKKLMQQYNYIKKMSAICLSPKTA